MQILIAILGGCLFFTALLIGLFRHPVRLRLLREEGEFKVTLSYLFYHVILTDTAHPIDPRDFTARKWKKELLSLMRQKQRKKRRFHAKKSESAPKSRFRPIFYLRLTVRLLRALGAEHVPHVKLHLASLSLVYGTGRPDLTAILHGATAGALDYTLAALSSVARVRVSPDAITLAPVFHEQLLRYAFDATLSIPLLYYLSIFHSFIPNNERVLQVLEKRKRTLEKRRMRAQKSKRSNVLWRKTISGRSSVHH